MDKSQDSERLREAASGLEIELSNDAIQRFFELRDDLLRWNAKVNLTAITDPTDVLERHFLDSLGALRVSRGTRVLDVGSGAGFPGLAWGLARPALDITLVDSVGKKVAFIKQAIAKLGLGGRARGVHLRLEGAPQREGLGLFDTVVSRALMDVEPWLGLARSYVQPGGEVLAMVAHPPAEEALQAMAARSASQLDAVHRYQLPWSGDPRAVIRFVAV